MCWWLAWIRFCHFLFWWATYPGTSLKGSPGTHGLWRKLFRSNRETAGPNVLWYSAGLWRIMQAFLLNGLPGGRRSEWTMRSHQVFVCDYLKSTGNNLYTYTHNLITYTDARLTTSKGRRVYRRIRSRQNYPTAIYYRETYRYEYTHLRLGAVLVTFSYINLIAMVRAEIGGPLFICTNSDSREHSF